jgi:hypothetical protein
VKLLDFGIAKVLSSGVAGKKADTLTLASVMTPEYASPEQVNGKAITTLTDVYSLGVVLYELLTGHRPYRLLSAAMHEVARVIAEVEPTRPSDVVATSEPVSARDAIQITPEIVSAAREGDPGRLRKRLLGDLDSILLMALRKEPERRYGSVESFGEDLQRHLEQRTVLAREPNPWERLVRFWWRNRGGFTVGSAMVAMFCSGMVAVVLQARHNIQAAELDSRIVPFPRPLWLFGWGLALGAQMTAVYFSRAFMPAPHCEAGRRFHRRNGLGAGHDGRWWIERDLGWWHSRIAGTGSALRFFPPRAGLSFGTCWISGNALMLVLFMIGRRFGWKGQAIGLFVWTGAAIPGTHLVW